MKKISIAFAILFSVYTNAQEGFKAGVHLGFPVGLAGDYSNFNFGFDLTYMFEITDEFEVGPTTGFTHFTGKRVSGYYYNYDSKGFSAIPIAGIARYNINDFLFGSFGFGIGIPTNGTPVGVFYQPRFGYKNKVIDAFAYFRGIGKGDSSIGFGIAYKFNN